VLPARPRLPFVTTPKASASARTARVMLLELVPHQYQPGGGRGVR
jgi:hypothetical protein